MPEADLEDAVQDVLAVLIRRIDAVDPARPARPWLSGVARRIAPKYRNRGRSSQPLGEEHTAVRPGQESRMVLSQLLRRLDGPDLELFLLMDVQGLSAREAGERLELNPNTVAYRIRRARKELDRIVARDRLRDAVRVPALVPWPLAASVTAVILGCVGVAAVRGCDRESDGPDSMIGTPWGEPEQKDPPQGPHNAKIEAGGNPRTFAPDDEPELPFIALPTQTRFEGKSAPSIDAPGGKRFTTERWYRIRGSEVDFRARFSSPDGTAEMSLEVDAPSLSLVDGDPGRSYRVNPGKPRMHEVTFRVSEPGPHRVTPGGASMCLCRTNGVVSTCPGACADPVPPDPADYGTGVLEQWTNVNRCNRAIDLYAVPPTGRSPRLRPLGPPMLRLDPGESRTIEIDAGLHLALFGDDEEGSVGGDTNDGGTLTWSCTGVSWSDAE